MNKTVQDKTTDNPASASTVRAVKVPLRKRLAQPKSLLVLVVAILAVAIPTVFIVINNKSIPSDNPSIQAEDTNIEAAPPLDPAAVTKAQQTEMLSGSIVSYAEESVVVRAGDSTQELHITPETMYATGPDYIDGKKEAVKPGMETQVVYNKETKEVYSLWYAQ